MSRQRYDSDGNPVTLDTLCRREPGWAASRIELLEAERDAATARAGRAERDLGNLLARIHGDGGQYQAEHGTEKAVADADSMVARAFADRHELLAERDRYRAAMERLERYHECPPGHARFLLTHEQAEQLMLTPEPDVDMGDPFEGL